MKAALDHKGRDIHHPRRRRVKWEGLGAAGGARKHRGCDLCDPRRRPLCGERGVPTLRAAIAFAIVGSMERSEGFALVTGASAGLGHALCQQFAKHKIGVIAVARREDRLQALCQELEAQHGTTNHALAADLSSREGVEKLVKALESLGLDIFYLVNNAGIAQQGRFDQVDFEREMAIVQVNVAAVVHLCRALVPGMIQRGGGHILNISSTAGFQAGPYMSSYYASKAFVTTFSEGLAYELADQNVYVTAACPGPIHTEFAQSAGTQDSNLFHSGGVSSAQEVAKMAFDAMMKKRRMEVLGLRNKMLALGSRLGPRSAAIRIAAHLNRDKGE